MDKYRQMNKDYFGRDGYANSLDQIRLFCMTGTRPANAHGKWNGQRRRDIGGAHQS